MSYDCWELRKIIADESTALEERDKVAEELEQIAHQGDPHAQYLMGLLYRDGGLLIPDTAKAQKLLERAAEQDLDAAQYALGKLYLSDDADVHDPTKGIYWLKRAADNGNEYAAYRLGKEYLSGNTEGCGPAAHTLPRSQTHIRHIGPTKRCRRENRQQYAGSLRRGLHPAHIHPCHPPKAG